MCRCRLKQVTCTHATHSQPRPSCCSYRYALHFCISQERHCSGSTCRLTGLWLGAACWVVCSLGEVRAPLLPGSRGVRCGDSPIRKGVFPLHRLAVCLSSCDTTTTADHVCLHAKGPSPALRLHSKNFGYGTWRCRDYGALIGHEMAPTRMCQILHGLQACRQLTLSRNSA